MRRRVSIVVLAVLVAVAVVVLWSRSLRDAGRVDEGTSRSESDASTTELAARPTPVASRDPARKDAMPAAPSDEASAPVTVRGAVTNAAGAPIGGASVEIAVWRGSSVRVEGASGKTAPDGTYRVTLPAYSALDDDARRSCSIHVKAVALGFALGGNEWSASESNSSRPAEIVIDLRLLEGGAAQSLTGRVLGVDGKPAVRADVAACKGTATEMNTRTDGEGRFLLPMGSPGRYVVAAFDPAQGVATSDAIELAAGAQREIPDLQLRSAGVIEGRAVLPDGTAPPPIDISISPAPEAPRLFESCDPRSAAPGSIGVSTDAEGRFAFRFLRPGKYWVGPKPPLLVEADTHDVRLVIRERFLVIHPVDAKGAPFPGASVAYETLSSADPDDPDLGAGDFSSGGAEQVLSFDRPEHLLVSVSAGELEADVLDVAMPQDKWRVDVDAVLRPKGAYGKIHLDVVDEAGKPVEPWFAEARGAIGGRAHSIVGSASWASGAGGTSAPVRPAVYELVVTAFDFVPRKPGEPSFGRALTTVTVRPGEPATKRVVVHPGGWLRVRLVLPEGADPIRGGGLVVRDGPDTRPIRGTFTDAAKPGEWGGLEAGGPQFFSQSLEPDRYTFVLRAEGYRELRAGFVIRAGETTDVEAKPEPR